VKGGKVLDDKAIWIIFNTDKNQGLDLFIAKYKTPLYKLKDNCGSCGYAVDPEWNICPKCASKLK
jgi:uncharacterized OB-fold protein